jgi:hypothetical protein
MAGFSPEKRKRSLGRSKFKDFSSIQSLLLSKKILLRYMNSLNKVYKEITITKECT